MNTPPFEVRLLGREDRTGFDCGVEVLNNWLQKQARQEMKRRIASCFVAIEAATGQIAGYYTLSACQIPLNRLDGEWSRKLPKYKAVPAVLIGRLAVAKAFHGKGLGAGMILDAVSRITRSDIAANLLVVDAKDETAAAFYKHLGFREIPEGDGKMVVPVDVVGRQLGG